MIKGYRWFIKFGYGMYEPEERTYLTLEEAINAMKKYLIGSDIPLSACGIDFAQEEDGSIEVLERIISPTETYYED